MHRYVLRRLLMMAPVLVGVIFVIFTLLYIAPGGMGSDQPFLAQFVTYVGRVFQLDLGHSFVTRRPVLTELSFALPNTARLAVISLAVAIVVGIPIGILCAIRHNSALDNIASVFGLVAFSVPNFWLGIMLIMLFSVNLGLLPVAGSSTPLHWVLPSLTIGLSLSGEFMRFTRSSMLEVIRQDYIRTAWAKGQTESLIIVKHALKNALIPLVTVIGLSFGGLMAGAILVEEIFAIHGVGGIMLTAIRTRDVPVVQGGVLIIALLFSLINLLVDILYGFIDPRIRAQYK